MQLVLNMILNLFMILSGFLALSRIYEKKCNFMWLKVACIFILSVSQALVSFIEKPFLNSLTMIVVLVAMTKLLIFTN